MDGELITGFAGAVLGAATTGIVVLVTLRHEFRLSRRAALLSALGELLEVHRDLIVDVHERGLRGENLRVSNVRLAHAHTVAVAMAKGAEESGLALAMNFVYASVKSAMLKLTRHPTVESIEAEGVAELEVAGSVYIKVVTYWISAPKPIARDLREIAGHAPPP